MSPSYTPPLRSVPRPPDRGDIEARVQWLERFEHYQAEKNGELLGAVQRVDANVTSIREQLAIQAALASNENKGYERWKGLLFNVLGAIAIAVVFLLARQAIIVQGARL